MTMSATEWLFTTKKQGLFDILGGICRSRGLNYFTETHSANNRDDLTDIIRQRALAWRVIPFPQIVVTV